MTNQSLTSPEDFIGLTTVYRRHPQLDDIKSLIEQGAEAAAFLPGSPDFLAVFQLHDLIIHADPKADNFISTEDGTVSALVDWDDVCLGHILIDVAEMLRSWGRPAANGAELNWPNMAAVLAGYAEAGLPLSPQDIVLLPAVLRGITVTLARRYLTDALAEAFFKWDAEKYPSLHTQNKSRAETMLNMAEYLLNNEMQLAERFQVAYTEGQLTA
jgi:Ser/Thr protein kinase RdoA (MazF antagonist)